MYNYEEQVSLLSQGSVTIVSEQMLLKKLECGAPLTVKLGMDPTSPDLHLGHAVVLSKLKQFQDFGHKIVFLIGNFTARIGDPTGKSKTRPPLTQGIIEENTKTYFEQVIRILDRSKIHVVFNAEWLDHLTSKDFIGLCSKITLAQLIERDDFSQRLAKHQPIGFHELLYPLLQAYDSVVLRADVELGGTDQTFNLMMGRELQEHYGQQPQIIITTPILEGLDGVQKMSKSLGNTIGLSEPADQAYGKLMSISDNTMWNYWQTLMNISQKQIELWKEKIEKNQLHPMALKKEMAHAIIEKFWSKNEAVVAQEQFEALFQRKDYSQATAVQLPGSTSNPLSIIDLLKAINAIKTSSEGYRLIAAGAVSVDNKLIADPKTLITLQSQIIIKVGKHRIYRLI